MYTAEIISKEIIEGKIVVKVKFSNGMTDIIDTFETTQGQSDNWPQQGIERKVKDLNGLSSLLTKVQIGLVDVPVPTPVEVEVQQDYTDYKNDLALFDKYVSAMSKGFTSQQEAGFIVLKQKLTDNFKPEYLAFF